MSAPRVLTIAAEIAAPAHIVAGSVRAELTPMRSRTGYVRRRVAKAALVRANAPIVPAQPTDSAPPTTPDTPTTLVVSDRGLLRCRITAVTPMRSILVLEHVRARPYVPRSFRRRALETIAAAVDTRARAAARHGTRSGASTVPLHKATRPPQPRRNA